MTAHTGISGIIPFYFQVNGDLEILQKQNGKCYIYADDLNGDVADYGPLHVGVDINTNFEVLPQHDISAVEALPPYDPFEYW